MTMPVSDLKPEVTAFFDPDTFTITYLVRDPTSNACAIIDPVLDLDYAAGRTATKSADRVIDVVTSAGLTLDWIIETHVHADHLTAAAYLRDRLGGRVGIARQVTVVQTVFGEVFDEGPSFRRDGSQFDHLFDEGETYRIGNMTGVAWHTPGHTPACMTHVIGDAAFVGDTLFMPDMGTARADFPGGDARQLYRSIQRVLALPPETRLFMCHDYAPGGREYRWESTVAAERAANIHVRDGVDEDAFVAMRTARDATLDMPRLILPSLQINMRSGLMPPETPAGRRFLKVPLNHF
ncbi:MAG: MBL fold metallo-hydrolase [Alphaproteobacteria bacterium]|nr:MBL fold metallo-hydrolase [Alphaproteobacteria bacterium]TAD89751.1 MAG: MBL fold metallo-hydrolase [Alphaproteobacteria bacterium]